MSVLSLFGQVKHFIFDIDGVLTDGSLLLHPEGELLRTMHIKDGYALQLAIQKGYSITVISGAQGDVIRKRLNGLGINDIHLGISNKLELFDTLSISLNQSLYMGDDMPDVEVMKKVMLPVCPADACEEVKQISKYISPLPGGRGCVRDVIEKVLKLNNHWF